MASIPSSSDPIVQPLLDQLDANLNRYIALAGTSGKIVETEPGHAVPLAELFRDELVKLMGDVAVAALVALVDKYGVGFNTGLLKIDPDQNVRMYLKERFGVKP